MMPVAGASAHHEAPQQLPPGFRFHPTDEELILHYLRNRAGSMPCPVPIIADVDIYKFDPWDLPCKAAYGDGEWYFFSPRDRKYPNGIRPNRAAGSGYWKATGTDKPIHDSNSGESVGVKKALVFYKGRPPKGTKTSWIMHEYRLAAAADAYRSAPVKFRNVSMRLDDWVLCRIYKKSGQASPMVPPLADYDQLLDHDEHSSGGGFVVEDIISGSFYAPTSSSTTTTAGSMNNNNTTHQLPTTIPPPVSDDLVFDDYSLAHIFDTAGVDQHAPFAMHPSLNQILTVDSSESSELIYSSDYPIGAGLAKRKAMSPADEYGVVADAGNKRLHLSCFDGAPQPATGGFLPAHSQVMLGDRLTNHTMLPQF